MMVTSGNQDENGDGASPCASEDVGSVSLVFLGKQCAGNPGDSFPASYRSETTPGAEGMQSLGFRDTALAYYNAPTSGDPSNKATLDALADRFGEDFLAWLQFSGQSELSGAIAVEPNGLYEEIVIDYFFDDQGRGNCKTTFFTPPARGFPSELGHYDSEADCDLTATPCVFFYGPPGKCNDDNKLTLTRYQLCLNDGRLLATFVSTDTMN